MDKVSSFKLRVGKVKMGLITGKFTVICPNNNLTKERISPHPLLAGMAGSRSFHVESKGLLTQIRGGLGEWYTPSNL